MIKLSLSGTLSLLFFPVVYRAPIESLMHFSALLISLLSFHPFDTTETIPGSIPNMNMSCITPEPKSHSFVDTIHGLTDKLHQLSHLGHDDKSKSGKFSTNSLLILVLLSAHDRVALILPLHPPQKVARGVISRQCFSRHDSSFSHGHSKLTGSD